jgi:hypothetical protein
MANSLGTFSQPPSSFSAGFIQSSGTGGMFDRVNALRAGGSEFGGTRAGAMGQFAGSAARGIVNAGASTAEAAYNIGRLGNPAAAEVERARMRGRIAGQQFDTLAQSLSVYGRSASDTVMAVDRFQSSGFLARGSDMSNLSSMIAMGNIAGIGANEAAGALMGLNNPQSIYAAQAAGVSLLGPGGRPADQYEIVNQIVGQYTQGRSRDEIERALTVGTGNLWNTMRGFMSEEQIELFRPIIQEATEMGRPITAADFEKFQTDLLPAGERSEQELAREQVGYGLKDAKAVDEAFASATGSVAAYTEAVAEAEGALGTTITKINEFGSTFDTLRAKGVPSFLAALAGAAEAAGFGLPSSDGSTRGSAEGDANVAADMTVKVHQGEMVLPSRIATAVRQELGVGSATEFSGSPMAPVRSSLGFSGASARGGSPTVNVNVYVQQASEAEARRLASMVQKYLKDGSELSGVGLGQVMM